MVKCKQLNEILARAKYAIEKRTKAQSKNPLEAYRTKVRLRYLRTNAVGIHLRQCDKCIEQYPDGEKMLDYYMAFINDLDDEYKSMFIETDEFRAERKAYYKMAVNRLQ